VIRVRRCRAAGCHSLGALGHRVGDGDDAHVGELEQIPQMAAGDPTTADETDPSRLHPSTSYRPQPVARPCDDLFVDGGRLCRHPAGTELLLLPAPARLPPRRSERGGRQNLVQRTGERARVIQIHQTPGPSVDDRLGESADTGADDRLTE